MTPGERIKQLREILDKTQGGFGAPLGFKWYKIKDIEAGKIKVSPDIATKIENSYSFRFEWILTGEGPMRKEVFSPTEPATPLYNKDMATPEYSHPGIDPALQAMSDIKDIFASGDPILIPAIQANINAFKRSLQRERQFSQLINENKELRDSIARLQSQLDDLRRQVDRLTAPSTTAEQQEAS